MKHVWLLAAAAALPTFAYGATSAGFLARVPGLPANAQAAYAMWNDSYGDLTVGTQYKALQADLQNAMTSGLPGQDTQAAKKSQDIMARYNTPQGQAELKRMPPAQRMALAQQMLAGAGIGVHPAAGPVSPGDAALMKQIQFYPATAQIMQKTVAIQSASTALQAQWDKDATALGVAESAERNKLALCRGETGGPSPLAVKAVLLKYADKTIALADSYLPKFNGMAQQFRQTIAPEVAYGDNAAASWEKLSNPGLKSQTMIVARGAQSSALNDTARYLAFVEDISKKAAGTVAGRKNLEQLYSNVKGC
jgi:hypothetical protein